MKQDFKVQKTDKSRSKGMGTTRNYKESKVCIKSKKHV